MVESSSRERGAALVMALGALGGLALLAVIVVAMASSTKWTEFTEFTHTRAFYSADAGGEAALNWIRFQDTPPALVDSTNAVFLAAGYSAMSADHDYKYDVQFSRKRFRPGWSLQYHDFEYLVVASGASVQQSEAEIELRATRLFEEGY